MKRQKKGYQICRSSSTDLNIICYIYPKYSSTELTVTVTEWLASFLFDTSFWKFQYKNTASSFFFSSFITALVNARICCIQFDRAAIKVMNNLPLLLAVMNCEVETISAQKQFGITTQTLQNHVHGTIVPRHVQFCSILRKPQRCLAVRMQFVWLSLGYRASVLRNFNHFAHFVGYIARHVWKQYYHPTAVLHLLECLQFRWQRYLRLSGVRISNDKQNHASDINKAQFLSLILIVWQIFE